MPTEYLHVEPAFEEWAHKMKMEHHRDLEEVTVTYLYARATKDGEPALKKNGFACDAIIQITKHKDRVAGLNDVILTVDQDRWLKKTVRQREALLDHEFMHIVIHGQTTDEGGRPKLSMRRHDYEFGGFHEVAKRHGHDSPEVQQHIFLREVYEQLELF